MTESEVISLADVTLACPSCSVKVGYSERVEHATKKCEELFVECPMKCGAKEDLDSLRIHLHRHCPLISTSQRPGKHTRMLTDSEVDE